MDEHNFCCCFFVKYHIREIKFINFLCATLVLYKKISKYQLIWKNNKITTYWFSWGFFFSIIPISTTSSDFGQMSCQSALSTSSAWRKDRTWSRAPPPPSPGWRPVPVGASSVAGVSPSNARCSFQAPDRSYASTFPFSANLSEIDVIFRVVAERIFEYFGHGHSSKEQDLHGKLNKKCLHEFPSNFWEFYRDKRKVM